MNVFRFMDKSHVKAASIYSKKRPKARVEGQIFILVDIFETNLNRLPYKKKERIFCRKIYVWQNGLIELFLLPRQVGLF